MVTIRYYNRAFPCHEGQSVLDVLLENGQDIPYSCEMGVCVTCVMQRVEGDVNPEAQAGLRDSLAAQGAFLPCVCQPTTDMLITDMDQRDMYSPAVVRTVEPLSDDVCRVFLEPTTPLYYRAGQFMNLRRKDGLARSYSLASVPSLDTLLEFHIKRLNNGAMSNWLMDDLKPGDHLGIQGPTGNCYYQMGRPDQNMLLVGNGTGLAPLIGIARDALSSGHTAPIRLYHGSQKKAGLYSGDSLRALEAEYDNFQYIPCVSRDSESEGYRKGRADDVAFSDTQSLKDWRVFLCGYPPMVNSATDRALSMQAKIEDIYTDPYELKDLRKQSRSVENDRRSQT
jgi:NAD(P)H-flavin reductase/ferredoxin